jgi:hypothetical protein
LKIMQMRFMVGSPGTIPLNRIGARAVADL